VWAWVAMIWLLGGAEQMSAPRVHISDGFGHRTVVEAIQGARRRLDRPECQKLFTDFRDENGRPLADNLLASTFTAPDYLARQILFVAADDGPQCRRDGVVAAFTAPGYQVVHVCTARFASRFVRDPVVAEVIVIHEMLHTLGLGENPPSSSAITGQVVKRCGRES
jgi:hypothetical protein